LKPILVLPLLLALGLAGCARDGFRSRGTIASEGTGIENWRESFQACTRAPFDGLSGSQTRSIVAFVWKEPQFPRPVVAPSVFHSDLPMRLEFSRGNQGTVATLHTLSHPGIRLDAKVCSTLDLKTQEDAPSTAEGRPSLSGEVALECGVEQAHIVAKFRFEGCKY
jgi:hypothetical protein